jgi:hypothetical protein
VPPRERRAADADRAAEPPSAKPPTKRSVAEPLFRAVWARVATLHQRHGCTMPAHCAEHTRLVHDQTGVAIDAPALVARASRAWLDLGRADARLTAWLDKTVVAAFTHIQALLGAVVRTVPADVNLPETRDSLVRHLCECLDTIDCYGLYFSECTDRGSFPSTSVDRPPSPDDLAGAAQKIETWLRHHAPTATKRRLVLAAILVHHGWEITGTTLQDKAAAVAKLLERRQRAKPAR